MLRLRDIMTTELITVSPDLSLREAMDVLTTNHISGAPVVSQRAVVGVLSLADFAEFAASSPGVPTEQPDPADWDDWEAEGALLDESEPPAAFFAELWEDAGADVVERMAQTGGPEWNVFSEHTVGEAMNRLVSALPPDTSIETAASYMRRTGIHRVLVMNGAELLGMVTTTDISNAVADHRMSPRVYVFGPRADARGG
jgi:CBS domain-containing protein